jgi:hypothetical protein
MAFLCTQTFLTDSTGGKIDGGKVLQNKIGHALRRVTGKHGVEKVRDVDSCKQADDGESPVIASLSGLDYPAAPHGLRTDRDFLRGEWKEIWKEVTIEFADEESGASIYVPNRRVRIGPFFLAERFTVRDLEKIVLHEFLHAGFDIEMRAAHHGLMEQVLIFNMGYHRPANPASLD